MSRGTDRNADLRIGESSFDLPLAAAIAAMPLVLIVAYVPREALLPAVAALAFATAALTATLGWTMRASARAGTITIWDLSGACALVGVAAGIFSEPLQVAQFFGAVSAVP